MSQDLLTVTFSEQTELPRSSKILDSHHSQTTEQNDNPPQTNQEHKGITISRSPPPVAYTGQTRCYITATTLKNQQSVVDTHSTKIKHANQFKKIEALANNTSYSPIISKSSETFTPNISSMSMNTNSVV